MYFTYKKPSVLLRFVGIIVVPGPLPYALMSRLRVAVKRNSNVSYYGNGVQQRDIVAFRTWSLKLVRGFHYYHGATGALLYFASLFDYLRLTMVKWVVSWDNLNIVIPRHGGIIFKTDQRYWEGMKSGIEATVCTSPCFNNNTPITLACPTPPTPAATYALQCFRPQEFIGELVVTGRWDGGEEGRESGQGKIGE